MSKYFSASTGGFYDDAIHAQMPDDAVAITEEQHAALLAGQSNGQRIVAGENGPELQDPPAPTPEQVKAALSGAVQTHMDAAAQAAGYDDIKSAVTYAEEPSVPKFQAEGQAFRAWRSLCWAKCYEVMAAVAAGERAVPTASELIAELPTLEVPA